MYDGGMGEDISDDEQDDYPPTLVFCSGDFTFPIWDYRLQIGLNNPIE
jgi:hypothetical protein